MMSLNRRSVITGLISLVAAPAIVRVSSIMPVKLMDNFHCGFVPCLDPAQIGKSFSSAEATAHYARLEAYMEELQADGVWGKLDALYVFDAPSERQALTNLITDKEDLTYEASAASQ